VFDIFLQILDEGKLHDRLGREGDFSNAVILFTSNIGAEQVSQSFAAGSAPSSTDLLETMSRHFRPEFLARLTEIVPFAPISEENVGRIFDIHLRPLHEQLRRQGITLVLTPEARHLLALSGFTPKYGARPITGVIRSQLRRPISRLIISGEARAGTTLTLSKPEGSDEVVWDTTYAEAVGVRSAPYCTIRLFTSEYSGLTVAVARAAAFTNTRVPGSKGPISRSRPPPTATHQLSSGSVSLVV
jgi:ATP-dependent Clp protease ATP-binding subunit ClpA